MSTDASSAASAGARTDRGRIRALAARAVGMEKLVYASIGRAILRRPAIPDGVRGFAYHAPTLTLLVVFIVLSAVEIFVVDMIVHRWLWIRIPLLVLGVWGVVWMVGVLCAHFMRPHVVGPEGVRVRDGMDMDIAVAWRDIRSVAVRKRSYEPKTPRVIEVEGGRVLVRHVTNETNIEIVLEGPTVVVLPGAPPKGGEQVVDAIRFWADEPEALLDEVRRHIGADASGAC